MASTRKTAGRKQSKNRSGEVVKKGRLHIPELEAAPRHVRPWSEEEEDILRQYYGRIKTRAIVDYLKEHYPPGRTYNAVSCKARILGLLCGGGDE